MLHTETYYRTCVIVLRKGQCVHLYQAIDDRLAVEENDDVGDSLRHHICETGLNVSAIRLQDGLEEATVVHQRYNSCANQK